MKPEKLKKIRAMLNSPASTENEKAICRKLLAKHPPEETPKRRAEDRQTLEDAFRRQAAQAQQSAFYNQNTGQDARQQAARNQQDAARHAAQGNQNTGFAFGAGGGILGALFGQAFGYQAPKPNYSQAEFERAQANINAQRKEQERNVDKLLKKTITENLAKALKGKKHGTNESD